MKYKTKVVMTGCVGMAVSVLLLICSLWEQQPLTELSRPGKGADSVTEHLQVQIGEDKTPIDVTVAAVPYDRKEEQTRIREASKNLETIFLGQNTSLDHVTRDLHMPTQIGDSEVTATISTTVYQLWRTNNDTLAFRWVLVNVAISAVVLLLVNLLEKKECSSGKSISGK